MSGAMREATSDEVLALRALSQLTVEGDTDAEAVETILWSSSVIERDVMYQLAKERPLQARWKARIVAIKLGPQE